LKREKNTGNDSIYLSVKFKSAGYNIGDKFTISYLNKEYDFTINGFYEDMFLGSVSIDYVTGFLISKERYSEIIEDFKSYNPTGKIIYVKHDLDSSEDLYDKFIKDNNLSGNSDIITINDTLIQLSCMVTPNIVAAMLIVFSLIIVIVSLIVTRFRIINCIDDEMQNFGALKAMGYTSKELILSMSLQFVIVSIIVSLVGSIISMNLLNPFAEILMADIWIKWIPNKDVFSVILTILIITLLVGITSYKVAKKIKNMTVINALRLQENSRSFKKNIIPFETSKGSINLLLALKSMLQSLKQNIFILIIGILITFSACFSIFLYYNIAVDSTAFLNMLINEQYSANVVLNEYNYDKEIINELSKNSEVKKAIYFDVKTSVFVNEKNSSIYIADDFSEFTNDNIYEGRNPKKDNEIAINTMLSKAINLSIGDKVNIKLNDKNESFEIVGLFQSGTTITNICKMTHNGYLRLDENFKQSNIIMYIDNEKNIDATLKDIEEKYDDKVLGTANYKQVIDDAIGSYVEMVSSLATMIVMVTLGVVILVLYLIIKTIIIKEKQAIGIKKALGFKTSDIKFQVIMSILPAVIIGSFIGMIITYFGANSVVIGMFSSIGIKKVDFIIKFPILLIVTLAICLSAFLISYLITSSIKKISAYSLIKE